MSSTSSSSPPPRSHQAPKRKRRRKRPTEAKWDTSESEEQVDRRRSHFDRSPDPQPVNRRDGRNFTSAYPERYRTDDIPPDPAYGLNVSEDASRARMRERRRALALGLFKVITRHDALPIEEEQPFLDYVKDCNTRRFNYVAVPKGFSNSNYPGTRYSAIEGVWPGCGKRYHVIWITQAGDIKMDRLVKLYEVESIQGHEIDGLSPSPKSLWFSLVDPRRDGGDQVKFDANLFWSVGLLWKHLKTCGVEVWDRELTALFRTETRPPPPPSTYRPGPSGAPLPHINTSIPPPMGASHRPVQTALVSLTNSGDQNNNPGAANVSTPSYTLGERYTGCLMEWRHSYGFLSCTLVPGKIFLHIRDIRTTDGEPVFTLSDPVGKSINFELSTDDVTGIRFRAIKAEMYG